MLFAEPVAELEAQGEDSCEEDDERGVMRMVVEVRDVEEDESDDEVEQAPERVDNGRGQSFAGRLGEGSGEWFSGDAFDEVGDGVREERSGKKCGEIGVPMHRWGHGGILVHFLFPHSSQRKD